MNVINIVGRLGRDPELQYIGDNLAVVEMSVATNRPKDKNGERVADWHRVKFFGKAAEVISQYFNKGSMIGITGSVQYRSYEKDGVTKYITEILGQNFHFVGGNDSEKQPTEAPARNTAPPRPQNRQQPNYDDDIPF